MTAPRQLIYVNKLIEEKQRRKLAKAPKQLVADAAFPKQRAFIDDPSPRKAAICSRRAGKSIGVGLFLFQEALAHPGCSCLYLAETYSQAKKGMFRQVLAKINRDHKLGATFSEAELSVRLPNGSIIYLQGADTATQQQEAIRGSHYRLVVVDEAGSFRNELGTFYEETLEPLVADELGTICLIGTPRGIKNLFYEVTQLNKPGWSLHRWHVRDNPHMAEQFAAIESRARLLDPDFAARPKWRQEWESEWVIDEGSLVYHFNEARNTAPELPAGESWLHVVGIDLGYNDDTAWVVLAYNLHDHTIYVREVKKERHLILSQVAEFTHHLIRTYDPHALVIDGAAKQSVEEMKQRYELPLEAADKLGKADHIEMLNSDLVTGRIKLLPGTEPLSQEWEGLHWDDKALKSGRRVEDPRCPNHLSDAMLYAWRRTRAYAPQPRNVSHPEGSDEAMNAYWEAQSARMEREARDPLSILDY